MSRKFALGICTAAAILLGVAASGTASPTSNTRPSNFSNFHTPRQYYSGWQSHPTRKYYYRKYYTKPSGDYCGYKHHYVIWHPSRPKHCYFYNPYKKAYWGRCCAGNCDGQYSLLPIQHRKPSLKEIPDAAFPTPGDPPPVPEATDGLLLDLPPDDLPSPNVG